MEKTKFQWVVLLAINLLCLTFTYAQRDANEKWLGLNLSVFLDQQNTTHEMRNPDGSVNTYELNIDNFANVGFAYRIVKNDKWFQEYGLTALAVKKEKDLGLFSNQNIDIFEPTGGSTKHLMGCWLRYEYGRWFPSGEGKKLSGGLSLSVDPFASFYRVVPATSSNFPVRGMQAGAELRFIPRIAWQIGSKMMLEIKIPVRLNTTYFDHQRTDNPILAVEDRIQDRFVHRWKIDGWQCAAGLSIRL